MKSICNVIVDITLIVVIFTNFKINNNRKSLIWPVKNADITQKYVKLPIKWLNIFYHIKYNEEKYIILFHTIFYITLIIF